MTEKTYLELCKNDKKTVQISVWRDTGEKLSPSAAYYEVKGSEKDNVVVPRSQAQISNPPNYNQIYTQIGPTVTASAAEYDIYWEVHTDDGDQTNHCTKLLVIDTC